MEVDNINVVPSTEKHYFHQNLVQGMKTNTFYTHKLRKDIKALFSFLPLVKHVNLIRKRYVPESNKSR